MRTRLLIPLLGLLFLTDLGYTAWQFHQQPLDGDMAWNLLPDPEVAPILNDPLGVGALLTGDTYANPNRFFCHWAFRTYLLHAPVVLQRLTDPVSSVYLACTLAKVLIHLLLLLLLSRLISGGWRVRGLPFVGALCLLFPLFQTSGYRNALGIVDPSTTYAFFYALPAAALLLLLLPFADRLIHRKVVSPGGWSLAGLAGLAVVVALSGPLNPGIVLVLTVLLGVAWWRGCHWPRNYVFLWGWVVFLSIYSLWLGRYNSLTIASDLPLLERYARLPAGLFGLLTTKLAWPLLLGGLAVNYALLEQRYRNYYGWWLAFALLYGLLLPLGGYREYRPDLLRYDTILPVTIGAFWLYGTGALRLLRLGKYRWYPALPLAIALFFTLADGPVRDTNDCEREALQTIAGADHGPVPVDCPVLFWRPVHDPATSRDNSELLVRWGIRRDVVLYYQPLR